MEVRVGVIYSPKEIDIELAADIDRDEFKRRVEEALADDDHVLWLRDHHGREVAIPSGKVAYVEIGSPESERRIGFATG